MNKTDAFVTVLLIVRISTFRILKKCFAIQQIPNTYNLYNELSIQEALIGYIASFFFFQ